MDDAFADITARMGRTPIYELLGIGLAAAGDGAVTLIQAMELAAPTGSVTVKSAPPTERFSARRSPW